MCICCTTLLIYTLLVIFQESKQKWSWNDCNQNKSTDNKTRPPPPPSWFKSTDEVDALKVLFMDSQAVVVVVVPLSLSLHVIYLSYRRSLVCASLSPISPRSANFRHSFAIPSYHTTNERNRSKFNSIEQVAALALHVPTCRSR